MLSNSSYVFQQAASSNYAHCGHICKLCVYYKYYAILYVQFSTALMSEAKGFSLDIKYVEFIDRLRNYYLINVHFTTRSYLNNY